MLYLCTSYANWYTREKMLIGVFRLILIVFFVRVKLIGTLEHNLVFGITVRLSLLWYKTMEEDGIFGRKNMGQAQCLAQRHHISIYHMLKLYSHLSIFSYRYVYNAPGTRIGKCTVKTIVSKATRVSRWVTCYKYNQVLHSWI